MSGDPRRRTVSVVVPVHNGSRTLRQSLRPLLAGGDDRLLEVLVVDDGSTDDSATVARDGGARVIPSGGRLGPAGARNTAVREARGEIVIFIDADVVTHPDTVGRVCDAFADEQTVAVFGSYDDRPPDRGFASLYMNLRHHHGHRHPSDDAQTFWTGLGAVRRDAFLAVGGFDADRYPVPSIEDIDLGRRLRDAGGRIRRRPEIQATHLKRWSLPEVIRTDIFRRGLPWARLMMAHPGAFTDLNVRGGERLRAGLALALLLSGAAAVGGVVPVWVPVLLFVAAMLANRRLTEVFVRSGGWWLALRAMLFHQLYYLYSSATYTIAAIRHRLLH